MIRDAQLLPNGLDPLVLVVAAFVIGVLLRLRTLRSSRR
jgi:hypothetical protein